MKIAIIGTGIAGLTFAATLKKSNSCINVEIFEKDTSPTSRFQGFAIGLNQENGLDTLKKLGLYDELINNPTSKLINNFIMEDTKGRCLYNSMNKQQELAIRVQRESMRAALQNCIKDQKIHYGFQAIDAQKKGDKYEIIFKNDHRVLADYVILADGANSQIRQTLIGKNNRNYLGLVGISGLSQLKDIPDNLQGGYYMGMGNGSSIFSYGQPNGIYYSFTMQQKNVFKYDQDSKEALYKLLCKKTKRWKSIVKQLITYTDITTLNLRKYYDGEPLEKCHYNNIFMIGDTAHYMSPYQGLGANLALIDGYELAEAFNKHHLNSDFKQQLDLLEKKILSRGKSAIEISRTRAQQFHQKNMLFSVRRKYQFWKLGKKTVQNTQITQ